MYYNELTDKQFIDFIKEHEHLSYNKIGEMLNASGATLHLRAKGLGYKKKKGLHKRPEAKYKDIELQQKVKELIDNNPEIGKKDIMRITGITLHTYQQLLTVIEVEKRPAKQVKNTKYGNPELIKLIERNKDNPDISDIRRQARELSGFSNITSTDIRRAASKSNIDIVPPKVLPKKNKPTGSKRFRLSPLEEIVHGFWNKREYIETNELSRKKAAN